MDADSVLLHMKLRPAFQFLLIIDKYSSVFHGRIVDNFIVLWKYQPLFLLYRNVRPEIPG